MLPKYNEQEELDFLKEYDKTKYERPLSSVDVSLLTLVNGNLCVLLSMRAEHPQKGKWGLPGVNIRPDIDEDVDSIAMRAVKEKTGLEDVTKWIEQLRTYGNGSRDPRGWSSSCAYFGLIPHQTGDLSKTRNVEMTKWFDVEDVPYMDIAFDHKNIIADAVARLKNKVGYTLIAMNLLPEEFTLFDLQKVHEQLLHTEIDKSSFRKRIENAVDIEPIPGKKTTGSNRPAQLYRRKESVPVSVFKRAL